MTTTAIPHRIARTGITTERGIRAIQTASSTQLLAIRIRTTITIHTPRIRTTTTLRIPIATRTAIPILHMDTGLIPTPTTLQTPITQQRQTITQRPQTITMAAATLDTMDRLSVIKIKTAPVGAVLILAIKMK